MTKYFSILLLSIFLNCSGQSNKSIVGKWESNKRDFVSSDNKYKVLKSQKTPYFEIYEFNTNGKGTDFTVEGHPSSFDYRISNDTLFIGKFIAIIDTLTETKLVYTRLDGILKKPELRQFFTRTK